MGENEASLLSDILRARLCDTRPHVIAFGREGRGDYNHEAKAYSDPWIVRRAMKPDWTVCATSRLQQRSQKLVQ